MGQYDDFIDLADDLLTEWGSENAIFVQPGSAGTYNPSTGSYSGATADTDVSINAIFTPVSTYMIDNTNVLVGDVIIKVSPKGLSTIPVTGNKIKRSSETYTILNPKNIKPGDQNVLLIYHARAD